MIQVGRRANFTPSQSRSDTIVHGGESTNERASRTGCVRTVINVLRYQLLATASYSRDTVRGRIMIIVIVIIIMIIILKAATYSYTALSSGLLLVKAPLSLCLVVAPVFAH